MSFGPKATQQAIYTALTGDSTLMALIQGVFDNVPDNQTFPYITIGEGDWNDRGSHSTEGLTGSITINTWSQARGRKTVLDIQAEIDRILHNTNVSISGWSIISLRRDFSTILVEDDNLTYHGVSRFKILIGQT